MLRSLGHWLRLCGDRGLLLTLDIRRLARALPPGADGLRYSPAAVMDAHEVLRQMIDDADHLEGLLLIVLADTSFLDGDPRRSIHSYPALKMLSWPSFPWTSICRRTPEDGCFRDAETRDPGAG